MFDGNTLNKWQDPHKLSPPGDSWSIEDGCIKANSHPKLREDLVSRDTYRDFEFEFDWRISPGGNSGVKYRVQEFVVLPRDRYPEPDKFENFVQEVMAKPALPRTQIKPGEQIEVYVIGFEYQVIDNAAHKDAQRGGKYQSGALYDIAGAEKEVVKPVGQFNQARIVVSGDKVQHWLNGTKVVDTSLASESVKEASAKRWGSSHPVYKLLTEQKRAATPITLQNHNDEAWFKNIRIRTL
ncbi:MAG: DUF1080 domain-containing protein [Bryobacteraceae bacterium]